MGRRTARGLAILLLTGLLGLTAGCRAAGTPEPSPNESSSSDLVESPKEFDGSDLTFEGEVIGEAMVRGENAWLHINDDAYYVKNVEEGANLGGFNSGMAVWIPADELADVEHYGDYTHEGDIVTVRGVFNAACGEHGGDMDIHATALTVVTPGHVVVDRVRPGKIATAVGLVLAAVALYVLLRSTEQSIAYRRR
jgi:hypothetical protein